MKPTIAGLICTLILASSGSPQVPAQRPTFDQHALSVKETELYRRIENGDYTALTDATAFSTEKAISFLWSYSNPSNPARDAARAALKQVPGYPEYFAKRFADEAKRGMVDYRDLKIISAIGTPEAAAVVAPYLFDFTTSPPQGDVLSATTAFSAAVAIGAMKLPDAPKLARPGSLTSSEMVALQQWVIDKGWVPKEWQPKVGQGEMIEELRRWERGVRVPSRDETLIPPTPSTTTPVVATTPTTPPAAAPAPEPPKPAEPAAMSAKEAQTPPIWPWAAALLAAGIIIALVIKRRT